MGAAAGAGGAAVRADWGGGGPGDAAPAAAGPLPRTGESGHDTHAGFVELMEWATAHGLRRGLASTSSRDWVDRVVDGLAVRHHFHALVAGDEVSACKPAPDVYLRAAERLGVSPHQCLALEDSAPGVASAKAAGMRCIAIPNRVTCYQDLSAADLRVARLGEVTVDLLRTL